jgi:molybdopterin synthase catalytic subunit
VGVVRDHHEGKKTVAIFYEAYTEMAQMEMRRIARELEEEFPEARVAFQHRVGRLAVGEASVAVVASAPHREEAFRACRAAIDRIKQTVPIWKKEIRPDGAEEWVVPTGRES